VPARFTQDGAGRILHRRDGEDVFGANPSALEIVERGGDCVDAHAVLI
jgi:hypothetical protein